VIATSLIIAAVGIILPFTWLGGTLGFVPLPPAYWVPLCLILWATPCFAPHEDVVHPQIRLD
jgi:hypothetical protein